MDWLQGALVALDQGDDDPAAAWLRGEPAVVTTPRGVRGYDRWLTDALGTLLGFRMGYDPAADRTTAQRAFLILKGTGLTALRAADVDDRAALHRFASFRGPVNRLDLALDVRHPLVTPRAFRDQHEQGQIVTRLTRPGWWGDDENGATWYLGKDDVLVRVYDKSAERNRHGVTMVDGVTRCEMQLRAKSARAAFKRLLALTPEEWAEKFAPLVVGWFLNKVRPLGVAVPRNPQRVPTWGPLLEAFEGIGPVRLGRDEVDRALGERIQGQLANFDNLTRGGYLALVKEMLGTARFLQAIERGTLDTSQLELLTYTHADPQRLKQLLAAAGLDYLAEKPEDPQRSFA